MVRNYKRKNRYCRYTNLSEDKFRSLIHAWFRLDSVAQAADAAEVDEETARRFFQRIRQRVMNDEEISGWMGGGTDRYPETGDPSWELIYECLIECPRYEETAIEMPIPDTVRVKYNIPDRHQYMNKFMVMGLYDRFETTHCYACPMQREMALDRMIFTYIGLYMLKFGSIPKKNFKEWFFEINFRINVQSKHTKYHDQSFTPNDFLEILENNPL